MKYVIYGAGLTGRGYIPKCIENKNDTIIFVDKNSNLVEKLKKNPKYFIHFPQSKAKIEITNYYAYQFGDESKYKYLFDADYFMTAVGVDNLTDVTEDLGKIQSKFGNQVAIITHENGINPSEVIKKCIKEKNLKSQNFKIAQSAVFCSTVLSSSPANPLDILSEELHYYPIERKLDLPAPPFKNIEYVDDFELFLKRKIYTYNCLAAVIGYMGYLKGYVVFSDAANDKEIRLLVKKLLIELNPSMANYFGILNAKQEDFSGKAVAKFRNRYIIDSVYRNIREPKRKLGKNERIIAPLMIMERNHKQSCILKFTAAAALQYWIESSEEKNMNTIDLEELIKATAIKDTRIIEDIKFFALQIQKNRKKLSILKILQFEKLP